MQLSAISLALTRLGWLSTFTPASLFTNGEQGVWYDPSDLTTLYRDAAGTTPVTAVEQPVGLMLDKSKGLVLGPELVTNGDFSNGLTGWTQTGGYTPTVSGGALVFNGGSSTGGVYQTLGSVGKVYQITYTITAYTAGSFKVSVGTAFGPLRTAAGTYTETRQAIGDNLLRIYGEGTTFVGTIDNISVRELPGNHAFNSSGNSANFPVLSARYNLLTKTEQFDDAVWSNNRVTVTATAVIAPDGTTTADALQATASSNCYIRQSTSQPVSSTVKYRVQAKANTASYIIIVNNAIGGGAWFNLASGNVGTIQAGVTSATIYAGQNGYYICEVTGTTAASIPANSVDIYVCDGDGSTTATSGKNVYIWGADLRVANDALNQPSYQRVNTSTDYDTVGFKPYLRFNGTNQWMQTNSIDFTYGDKMFVCAGVRYFTTADQVVLELSVNRNTNDGTFISSVGNTAKLLWASKGTVGVEITSPSAITVPITNVLSGIGNISGDQATLRVNGTQAAISTSDQGTGNYGNYPLYIGARAGSSLWFNGRLYGMVVAGKQASAAEITSTETYLNQKTGAWS